MNPQPTIFISSIISEFYDLRGALRYFLGKSGFRVLMSEEADFGADCGRDSLDNCKEQIEKSDYYLLLVGNKPGTIFQIDKKNTTVTFEEFRHYISLVRKGKSLNLIAFVRQQAWDNYLRNDTTQINELQIELIKELVENSLFENKKIGRWRYTFDKFSDIIAVLQTNQNGLFLESTRKSGIFRTYIKREISEIFKALLEKKEETGTISAITDIVKLPDLGHLDTLSRSKIDRQTATYIIGFCTVISSKDSLMRKINRVFNYIAQGEFSRFDVVEEKYVLPEYIKLTIQTLEILEKIFDNAKTSDLYEQLRNRASDSFFISGIEYLFVKSAYMDLRFSILRLASLTKCFHLNWYDFEKRPDNFYEYRGRAGEKISDSELLQFAENYLAK
ncbi:DUF4062 domain-containing protein [Algoriphagus sp. H41]|uniref:DUF4062 domain-containing protein n=1 Tax=Algoriphagus oliviformis TaxID=2811231 RepID=A0ABS3C5L4_9BACT|nr:DUF4062 domain-containing protein [Algoriphagus oliviformis]MBN7812413.1 DUF4062 domain-containing protein [Algoriphagus oliviformis]